MLARFLPTGRKVTSHMPQGNGAYVSQDAGGRHLSPTYLAVLAGAILAPLLTWLPMLAYRFPALGLPAYPPAPGIDLWHLQTFWLAALGAIALLVGRQDRYLGLAVALAGLTIFYRGVRLDPTHSVIFALGALLLVAVRLAPPATARQVRHVLVALGAFQIAYLLQQHLGHDVLWGPMFGGQPVAHIQPLGTLGSVNASSGYVAILAPLLPLWLLPFAAFVVWQGHSLGALLALIIGLGVKARLRWPVWVAVALCTGALIFGFGLHRQTHAARVGIWGFALTRWVHADPIMGYGLGGWAQRVPVQQQEARYLPTGEIWLEAHNEPIQWLVETGLVGALLLTLWLWTHRRMFADPVWGAALTAFAVSALGWHPLHIVSQALVGILLVGLATRKEASCAV